MPFAFLIVGLVLVVSGVKGTSTQLLALIKGDLTGQNSYLYWIVAILAIGSVGYVPAFKPLSRAFLILVLVALVLKEGNSKNPGGGFFQQFTTALHSIANSQGSTASSSTSAIPTLPPLSALDSGI